MKFKVGDEICIKGKIVHIGGDRGAPYRIQTELYIDDYKDLWGNDSDISQVVEKIYVCPYCEIEYTKPDGAKTCCVDRSRS